MKYVTLGDGRQVTLGQYVKAWRTALAAPVDATFKSGLGGWAPQTRAATLRASSEPVCTIAVAVTTRDTSRVGSGALTSRGNWFRLLDRSTLRG